MDNNTEVVFENIEQRILTEIEEAHYAIFVSVAWFTNKRLFKALLEKAKANCYVSIIIQLDDINSQSGIDYEQIKIGRSECFTISKYTELLHDKFCVIDFRKVITGSYNWTYKASHNSENVIVLNDPTIASQYITRFEQQKAKFNIETNQVSEIKVQTTERDKTNVNKEERNISESVKIEKKVPITIEGKCICHPINPTDEKYCRNFGRDFSLQARDKNGHGWVDLGLSVLWSSEAMDGIYRWMDSKKFADYKDYEECRPKFQANFVGDGNDAAFLNWGEKWRIPTKTEFEELIEKCQWEKAVIPESNEKAVKVTGPNGNYIYFLIRDKFNRYWTSTKYNKYPNDNLKLAYCFILYGAMIKDRWLETPIDKRLNTPLPDDIQQEYDAKYESTRSVYIYSPCYIRPVADKKWKGKI